MCTKWFNLLNKYYITKYFLYKILIVVLLCIIYCFYVYFNLDILSSHISTDILNMRPEGGGNNPGSGFNSPGNNPNGSPNPGGGPGWRPYHYLPGIREHGERYPVDNPSPALVLETYNPADHIPAQSDKQLGVLIDYRFVHQVRSMGYINWNILNIFPSDSMVDKIAKERLLAHIYDHR